VLTGEPARIGSSSAVDEVVASITERRAVINQATGMLMLAYGVAADRGPVCAGTHGLTVHQRIGGDDSRLSDHDMTGSGQGHYGDTASGDSGNTCPPSTAMA